MRHKRKYFGKYDWVCERCGLHNSGSHTYPPLPSCEPKVQHPTVIGSAYTPFINKDKGEPETMAEMIGELGGW